MHNHIYYSTIHISQTLEKSRCPKTDEWIKTMGYIHIYTMEYNSAIKKNEVMLFVSCVRISRLEVGKVWGSTLTGRMHHLLAELMSSFKRPKAQRSHPGSRVLP
jgi:hypothetical protein